MARQQRTTTASFPQESPTAIARVALYARVSTLNNQDPEMQLAELREYAGRRGWQIVEEFTDQGVSGCKESRPALNRLMSDACRQRFDAVLVWKIDRFGRSLKHLVNALAELAALGVAFVSLRDNLDLSTPSGRLMFQIIGAMSEFERSLIQERVRAGIRNARAKGRRLGRPRVIVDASRVAALRARGNSWSQVQAELGVSKGTAQRAFAGCLAEFWAHRFTLGKCQCNCDRCSKPKCEWPMLNGKFAVTGDVAGFARLLCPPITALQALEQVSHRGVQTSGKHLQGDDPHFTLAAFNV